ncbi:MAG: GTPase Era, partial [Luteibaculum sp.]
MHRAGFVNILGKPNMGKSTLLNALFGEKLAIVTPKAQTTRHRMIAVYNEEQYQIVFSDTPGIIVNPHYKMQESMMKELKPALEDADTFLWITDCKDRGEMLEEQLTAISKSETPVLVLINKIDLASSTELEETVNFWHNTWPRAEILPISATEKANLDLIVPKLKSWLPENP